MQSTRRQGQFHRLSRRRLTRVVGIISAVMRVGIIQSAGTLVGAGFLPVVTRGRQRARVLERGVAGRHSR